MSVEKRVADISARVKELENTVHGLLTSPPREQAEKGECPQDAPTDKRHPTGGKVAFESKVKPTPTDTEHANNAWYKSWDKWKLRLEVIAIPFAIIYAVVTAVQWFDLRHNFKVSERAWVKVTCPIGPLDNLFPIKAEIANVGKSVTSPVSLTVFTRVVEKGKPPFNTGEEANEYTIREQPFFPGDTRTADIGIEGVNHELTDPERQALIKGDSYFVIFGAANYVEQYGPHWTKFCNWRGYTTGTYNTDPCVRYSSIGDGDTVPALPLQ